MDICHQLRCFIILSSTANIDFLFFSSFGLSFLWSSAVIVFGGWQLLYHNLTIVMMCYVLDGFLIHLPFVSSSDFLSLYCRHILECFCFSFLCSWWFWCLFCSCLELVWFSGVVLFSVALFSERNSSSFLYSFSINL